MVKNKQPDKQTEPPKTIVDILDSIAKHKDEVAKNQGFKGVLLFESNTEKPPKIFKKIASSPYFCDVKKALRNTQKGHGKGTSIEYDVLIECIKNAYQYSKDPKTYKTAEECLNDFVYIRSKINAIISHIENRIESSNKKKELSSWKNTLRDIRGDINIAIYRQNETRLFKDIKSQSKYTRKNKAFCLRLYAGLSIHYQGRQFASLIASIANTLFCEAEVSVDKEQVKSWITNNKESIESFIKRQKSSKSKIGFPNTEYF